MMNTAGFKTVSTIIPVGDAERLDRCAERTGTTRHRFIRNALTDAMRKAERQRSRKAS
jgi:predicted transcriptional regulator